MEPVAGDFFNSIDPERTSAHRPRRFPPPYSVEELAACFIVSDSAGQKPTHICFEEKLGRTRSSLEP
jgi:hypothetical protein